MSTSGSQRLQRPARVLLLTSYAGLLLVACTCLLAATTTLPPAAGALDAALQGFTVQDTRAADLGKSDADGAIAGVSREADALSYRSVRSCGVT